MYCKDCKFRKSDNTKEYHPYCTSEKLVEDGYDVTFKSDGNRLVYSYYEGGKFYVEDNFGCVHFEPTQAVTWQDLKSQSDSLQKLLAQKLLQLGDIQDKCKHPNLPPRQLTNEIEEYMDVCPDCGFISYCYSL